MAVSTQFKRTILRSLYASAVSDSITLNAALLAALTSRFETDGAGRIMTGSTLGGHSMTWSVYGAGRGTTPEQIMEAIEELLTLSETITAGTPAPADDAALYAAMLRELVPCTEFRMDHQYSRVQEGI